MRSLPDFTVAIALEHIDSNQVSQPIAVAINKIVGNELYYCEKGFGAYLNNRRIRVSKRTVNDSPLICLNDQAILTDEIKESLKLKNYSLRQYGCSTLEIAYTAAAKLDLAFFRQSDFQYFKPFTLLIKEAGGKVIENEKLGSNSVTDFLAINIEKHSQGYTFTHQIHISTPSRTFA